jgi:hypothetical protein
MIPMPVIALVARVFDKTYSRSRFENLFYLSGTKVEDPNRSNKLDTVTDWLRGINAQEPERAFEIFGKLIEPFMEGEDGFDDDREAVVEALRKHGLRYVNGGHVAKTSSGPGSATASLEGLLKRKEFPAVIEEFNRSTENAEAKPREAASAAANILEAICKEYIVEHVDLEMPSKQDLSTVFGVVRKHLGFDPGAMEDDDLKTILSGLITVVSGIARLRTHASSAHAQSTSKRTYRLEPRHARVAVHSAHALVVFILETWEKRESIGDNSASAPRKSLFKKVGPGLSG